MINQKTIKIDRGNFASNIFFLDKVNLLDKSKQHLEIGSGRGHMIKYLADNGFDVIGTDTNEKYIPFAKEEFGIDLQRMNGEELQFESDTFDTVLSFDVFEHIPNSDKHLSEVYRVLKPGGHYLFATPNKWINLPYTIIKNKSFTKHKAIHCSLHNYWELQNRLQKHGFSSQFEDIPVVNDFFKSKLKKVFGPFGVLGVYIINPDKLPLFLRSNFYVVAQKQSR